MSVLHLTNATFDQVIADNTVVLVDFWAPWCGPCRMLGPVIEELADDYDGKVAVCKINVDDEPELAVRFGVNTIPTVMVFKNGELAETRVGFAAKEVFEDMLL